MKVGATYTPDGRCEVAVWAPFARTVVVRFLAPDERTVTMQQGARGYWLTSVEGVAPGTRYLYCLDGELERPDPASSFQPEGVHGPSAVVDHTSFPWEDVSWQGVPLEELIMYEIHVGAFTQEGTFDAIVPRLGELAALGVNALEIMPVCQFPGERNWGYDGTYPYAVQNSYGGPDGLKRLVNECHKRGIVVILDVVYNHLGPEGNYIRDFGPYFTDKYRTPWGSALNFDDEYSDEVRNFFLENALYWLRDYRIDALRIDAVHGITDMSAKPFLQELAEEVANFSSEAGREFFLIAESDLNDTRLIRPRELGGYGMNAQWNDDFHHCVHGLLTGETKGYYVDFGKTGHLVKAMREGFVYSGEYSVYRKRRHGNSSKDIPAGRFIVFSQNHDQVGNTMFGERLTSLLRLEGIKVAAGAVLFSPYIPLLFMGEEYGEETPFLYFVSHTDPSLVEAVRQGRKEEFRAFSWKGEPPDPQNRETFLASKLNWERRGSGHHRVLLDFYQHLIEVRKTTPALSRLDKRSLNVRASEDDKVVFMQRGDNDRAVFCVLNFGLAAWTTGSFLPGGLWRKIFDSAETRWNGPGSLSPEIVSGEGVLTVREQSLVLYRKELV